MTKRRKDLESILDAIFFNRIRVDTALDQLEEYIDKALEEAKFKGFQEGVKSLTEIIKPPKGAIRVKLTKSK